MRHFLDFERPIAELEGKIDELRHLSTDSGLNIAEEVGRLEAQAERLLQQSYARLTPWQKVQVARHPERPRCLPWADGRSHGDGPGRQGRGRLLLRRLRTPAPPPPRAHDPPGNLRCS